MEAYREYQQASQYYGTAPTSHDDSSQVQIEKLKAEVESLKTEVQQYKTVSESFEKRVLDLHLELMKKDEEMTHLKEQMNLAGKDTDQSSEDFDCEVLRKLFVGGLNFSTTEEMLTEYFSQFGTVSDCIVMKDANTKKSRGFGFVVFATTAMLDAAQAARPHTIDNREVDTKRAMPRGETTKKQPGILAKKIFIGGMKTTTDEQTMRDYFTQFGTVDNVDILVDKATKRRRGFAYVTFTDSDPVDKAVLKKYHTIDGRRVEVKKAFTREEMKNKNNTQGGPTPIAQQLGNVVGNLLGNLGMGNMPGRNNMGGNFCGPQCGGNFGPGGNMGGNFGPCCNHMGGNFGHGGHFGQGGNFGPGGNMGGNFNGNYGHGGNFGPGGNRDNVGGGGGWGSGGNMGGGYGGGDGMGGNVSGGNSMGGGGGGGWNQGGNCGWNQGGGGGNNAGYTEAGGSQGVSGSNNWNSGSYGSGSAVGAGTGGGGKSGKPIRNTYTQRAAGPYGGGYGVSNVDQTGMQESASIRT